LLVNIKKFFWITCFLFFNILLAKSAFANNPLATEDQRNLDLLAIKIYNNFSFEELRQKAIEVYTKAYRAPLTQEAEDSIKSSVDELVFSSIQKAVNADPYYPKVYWVDAGPRTWFGMNVPGGRYSYDNPDTIYRTIPINSNLHYVIHGKRYSNLADVTFSLVENPNSLKTIAILTKNDLVVNPDGTYDITIDNQPANGRVNHIQSTIRARQLFIRHSFGDWTNSLPDALVVELLDNSGHSPISVPEIVAIAKKDLQISVLGYGYGTLGVVTKGHPINTMPQPKIDKIGGLITQASSFGYYQLNDDQAWIITIDPGPASYFVVPSTGPWTITSDPGSCQCSLNNFQSFPNADGKYRFIVSRKDPGYYNWISTCELHEGTLMIRWQGLPLPSTIQSSPSIETEMVPLNDISAYLPSDSKKITPDERQNLAKIRLYDYSQRSSE
jgi:hypothetical protein